MKTSYSRRRNGAPGSVGAWLGFGIAVVVVVIVIAVRALLPGAFFALTTPLLSTGSSLTGSVGGVAADLESNAKLAQENAALAEQIAALKDENAALTTRDQDLTQLLGGPVNGQDGIAAGVLARPPESPYDTLLVAAGSADGVAIGAQVFGQGGVPLGTIKHVSAHTAQVSLYSSPGRSTDGWVGENRLPITIAGASAGAFTATLPAGASVSPGDDIYVPGPGALPIGSVAKITSDPSSPELTIAIQPLVNLFSITEVEIARSAQ